MPENFATFAVRSDDFDGVRAKVERLFGVSMHLRDGNDSGWYYHSPMGDTTNIVRIYRNLMQDEEGEYVWMDEYEECKILIQISDSDDVEGQRRSFEEDLELRAVRIEFRDFMRDPPKPLTG